MRPITYPQPSFPSAPIPGLDDHGMGSTPRRQQSAFDTMENQFFKEGDELSTPAPASAGWEETTAVCRSRRRRRKLGAWAAVAAAAFAAFAVLAFWRASGKAEPVRVAYQEAAPVPSYVPPTPVPPAPPVAQPQAAATAISPAEAAVPADAPAPTESTAFRACKRAFDKRRGKLVLATCQRAFAEDPESAEVAAMLAKSEFDRGRARQALEWAKVTISLDQNRADAYVFLGGAEQASGRTAAAKLAYQRYLQLAPKGRYAGELRGILRRL